MSDIEQQVLALLTHGPKTCTEVGSELWGTEYRNPQSYARPAGKVLRRLAEAGKVQAVLENRRWVYKRCQQKGLA